MSRFVFLLAFVSLASCGDDEMKGDASGGYCSFTSSLFVTPETLVRGEAVEIVVRWETSTELSEPQVTLLAGPDYHIEVELPLAPALDQRRTYEVRQLNPFGLGAPTGSVSVLAEAPADGCAPSATTSFILTEATD